MAAPIEASKTRKRQPGRDPEAEKYAESIRARLTKFSTTPCSKCGGEHYISRIAEGAGVDPAGLWRFQNTPGALMLPETLKQVDRVLKTKGF
jgi:hypothetical protein